VVAVSMIPIVLVTAWVFQPHVAEIANEEGFLGRGEPTASPTAAGDDD